MQISELLIFALKVIKDECDKHGCCVECPLYCSNQCGLAGTGPTEWSIQVNEDK